MRQKSESKKTGKDKTDQYIAHCIDLIRQYRMRKNLSQEAVALLTGLSKSTIAMLETGDNAPTLRTCLKICHALDTKLSDLLREMGQ